MLSWFKKLLSPRRKTLVFDVETTGLTTRDRIVSLGYVWIEGTTFTREYDYLVFNPGRPSAVGAFRKHGWSDRTLRAQESFSVRAAELHRAFAAADLIVAHNVSFDIAFLNREFARCGFAPVGHRLYCTLEVARTLWPGERCCLDACVERFGLRRRSETHGANEDAWLAANLYRTFQGEREWQAPDEWVDPSNLRLVPPDASADDDEAALRLAEAIQGIGLKTATTLVRAGLRTARDVQSASSRDLAALPGIGERKIAAIRAAL